MKIGLAVVIWALGGGALAQALPQVTVTATRTEAAPFDVPASVDVDALTGEVERLAAELQVDVTLLD